MSYGEEIKSAARVLRGLGKTQEATADALGIGESTVQKWEAAGHFKGDGESEPWCPFDYSADQARVIFQVQREVITWSEGKKRSFTSTEAKRILWVAGVLPPDTPRLAVAMVAELYMAGPAPALDQWLAFHAHPQEHWPDQWADADARDWFAKEGGYAQALLASVFGWTPVRHLVTEEDREAVTEVRGIVENLTTEKRRAVAKQVGRAFAEADIERRRSQTELLNNFKQSKDGRLTRQATDAGQEEHDAKQTPAD